MARQRTTSELGSMPPDGPGRRAPYSDNPIVGVRGLRTKERILDAALQVFGEHGYGRSTIDRIGRLAGCSRATVYQYFSGKDDVFRHLAGQLARQLHASVEALEPVTGDATGWNALRSWAARSAETHARYEPVFRAFGAASAVDLDLGSDSRRITERNAELFQSKLAAPALAQRELEHAAPFLVVTATQSLSMATILRKANDDAYTRDRLADAVADVIHRTLFGVLPGVNARAPQEEADPPPLPIGPTLTGLLDRAAALASESQQNDRRALTSLLAVGHDVVVRQGHHGVRVEDVVEAAAVSHGAFYRYFENRDDYFRVVAVRSLNAVRTALADLPGDADRGALRKWLRRYNAVNAEHVAVIRVWVESNDDLVHDDLPAVFDWGRTQVAKLLAGRSFGDLTAESLVLLAFIDTFAYEPRRPAGIDAALAVIERGFLGRS